MNEEKKEPTSPPEVPRGIGAFAARKRQQLERFDQERKRLQQKMRDEREQLARDVAEAEARERRRQRNLELNSQRRVKFILGSMVFTALREKGRDALSITAMDLDGLKPLERELLDQALDSGRAA